MKSFITIVYCTLFSSALCQSTFLAENQRVSLAGITKKYHFGYVFRDSLTISLIDSVIIYSNHDKSIVKTEEYSWYDDDVQIRYEYLGSSGQDSIIRLYEGDTLKDVYTYKYDSLGRIQKYALETFVPGMRGFEWLYEYHDSLISQGRVTITTIYIVDGANKSVHFKVFDEFDEDNKKIKQTRGDNLNDPFAQIFEYKYDVSGQLLEEIISTAGVRHDVQTLPAQCQRENRIVFDNSDINSLRSVIRELLVENETILQSEECEDLVFIYKCSHPNIQLSINKRQPYWEGGRNVEIILTLDK